MDVVVRVGPLRDLPVIVLPAVALGECESLRDVGRVEPPLRVQPQGRLRPYRSPTDLRDHGVGRHRSQGRERGRRRGGDPVSVLRRHPEEDYDDQGVY